MLMATSQSQNSSLGDLFEVLQVSLAMLLRKMSDILNASRIRPKENPPLASTGGRPAYSNKFVVESFLTDITILPQIGRRMELIMMVH